VRRYVFITAEAQRTQRIFCELCASAVKKINLRVPLPFRPVFGSLPLR
jgi:hypothetical protein